MTATLIGAAEQANIAHDAVIRVFWNKEQQIFDWRSPLEPTDLFHYWWMAHALDCLVDAFERDQQMVHCARAKALLESVRKRNQALGFSNWHNEFYDDMQWMALACLRAFDSWQDEYFLEISQSLWADIRLGWSDICGGGIAWKKTQLDYKNTPANAPAAILAARLFQRFGQQSDWHWAQKIFTWLEQHLLSKDGLVWDGMNRTGAMQTDKNWLFTYNFGTMIGAALELKRPDIAKKVFYATLEYLTDTQKILPDEGNGDGGLFKGIFIRYVTPLALEHAAIADWLRHNAHSCWQILESNNQIAGTTWTQSAQSPTDLSNALSGLMLLEAQAKLERQNR